MLLPNQFIDGAEIILNFCPVAVFGNLATIGHFPNVVLEFASARTWYFFVIKVTPSIHACLRSGGYRNILIHRGFVENVSAILDELLAEHFSKFIGLATFGWAVVHVELHEVEENWIRSVHDPNALADDLTINCLESPEDDVVVHAESVLSSPIPR